MVLAAAALWGLSGAAAQFVMQRDGVPAGWLVTLRLAAAGLSLSVLCLWRGGLAGFVSPWQGRGAALRMVAFATLGLFAVQYTYIVAIRDANAAAATFLQYLGAGLIVLWGAIEARRAPHRSQIVALALALCGIALLATDGSLRSLAVPLPGLLWGLAAAVTLLLNTVLPAPLIRRAGSRPVLAWGMLVGLAAAVVVLRPPAWPAGATHAQALALIAYVVVFGTVVPFSLYMASIRHLPVGEAGLFANAEPVAAAIASLLWLHVRLGPWALAGGALVLAATTYLYRQPPATAPAVVTPAVGAGG